MSKPIIGIMPLWDEEKDSIWMLPGYMDGISMAGGIPVIFPFSKDLGEIEQLMSMCHGILFTGGQDVSPEFYHELPAEGTISCRKRDDMEAIVLGEAIRRGIPVLGICRGIQFINAALGGTLYQDLPTQYPSGIEHHQNPPYDNPVHTVDIMMGSPLYSCLGVAQLPVNSYHHQAVKEIASGLEVMAVSPEGLVEALYMPSHPFLWAVQWHPEFSYLKDDSSRKIFSAFLEAAGKEDMG